MPKPILHRLLSCLLCLAAMPVAAMDKPYPGPHIENERLLMVLVPRTPGQMAAFYEARGFPAEAIDLIGTTCFVTIHIHNRSDEVLWLEQDNWKFSSGDEPLVLLDDDWWQQQWDRIGLRQASRSTFGWTRLPRVRDLQPDEPVGGNVAFPGDTRTFTIDASFHTGADRRGGIVSYRFENIECPRTEPEP